MFRSIHSIEFVGRDCSVSVSELRGGQRHDMWLNLQNIKTGRIHLAITVIDVDEKVNFASFLVSWFAHYIVNHQWILQEGEPQVNNVGQSEEEKPDSTADKNTAWPDINRSVNLEEVPKVVDNLEPINIEGLDKTGVWVHHPGTGTPKTWEPRKGRSRRPETKVLGEDSSLRAGPGEVPCEDSSSSSDEENLDGNKRSTIRRGLHKISSVFHRSPKSESPSEKESPALMAPGPNIQPVGEKPTAVRIILDDTSKMKDVQSHKEIPFADNEEVVSPGKNHNKGVVKSILKHAGGGLKHVLSRKGSRKSKGGTELAIRDGQIDEESGSTDDSPSSSIECTPRGIGVQIIQGTSLSDKEFPEKAECLQKPLAGLEEDIDKLSAGKESLKSSLVEDCNVIKDSEKPVTVRKVSFEGIRPADHPSLDEFGNHDKIGSGSSVPIGGEGNGEIEKS